MTFEQHEGSTFFNAIRNTWGRGRRPQFISRGLYTTIHVDQQVMVHLSTGNVLSGYPLLTVMCLP